MSRSKRRLASLLALCCVLGLAACAQKTPGNTEVLADLEAANTNQALLERHERIASQRTYYNADGTKNHQYNYLDSERFVQEYEGQVLVDEGGVVYGRDGTEPYCYLFIDGSYEGFAAMYEQLSCYAPIEEEVVLSTEEKDGVLYIESEVPPQAQQEAVLEPGGYTVEEGDRYLLHYRTNAETMELLGFTETLVRADGEEILLAELEMVKDPEPYVVDEELRDMVYGEPKRTVTVVAGPGTEEERSFSQAVKQGCSVSLWADGGFELFTDEACTEPYVAGSLGTTEDATLYLVAAE